MKVTAWNDAEWVRITGHGLTVRQPFELVDGVWVSSEIPELQMLSLDECETIQEQAAVVTMHEVATFSIEVKDPSGGKALATKAWNRLWDFHLLSLAANAPCFILYNSSEGKGGTVYSVANRNLIVRPLSSSKELTPSALEWAKNHESNFRQLINNEQFSSAMRYFGNAHYLFDLEHRIMLLWAGIEGLLQVEAEHSRRLALYCALLSNGSLEERVELFDMVKKAYSLRSRVVHGAKPSKKKLESGYEDATRLLAELLAKCVELGRVPERAELDRASLSAQIL
ncbi:HEPN domain-containing protein [Erythrobacter sp. F6033]|uniref:HEPN domain-containing protein n=1 Tax=Erythrobacter sp. F6033 TaxID=2926401 RepID=UPI001FF53803|nr:HEPN domain-containing protein [Erythrobacter sp. F6033]MCK0127323.1 HEPN domain-containing protein [Erythrobacter sp. F6033]